MRKFIFIVMMLMATVSAVAQNIKVYNGPFEWAELNQVVKGFNFYAEEELTVKHINIYTSDKVLYNRTMNKTVNKHSVFTLKVTVDDPVFNFIETYWNILVQYEKDGNSYEALYRVLYNTLYDIQPHKFSDGIFIPCYRDSGYESNTTTSVNNKVKTNPKYKTVYKLGPLYIVGSKKLLHYGCY